MPIKWDAEADAKLMAGIIKVCGFKCTNSTARELAQWMGDDCTTRAIEHRISNIRKRAADFTPNGDEDATPPAKKRAKKSGLQLTPPSEKDEFKGKNKDGETKQQATDGIKVGEDIGEGLRAVRKVLVKEEADEGDEDGDLV